MRIAIIGGGNLGGAVGRGLSANHDVTFGVREGSDVTGGVGRGKTASVADAARAAEVVVLAVPSNAIGDAIAECGALDGKIVVDATNPVGPGITYGNADGVSNAERAQRLAPKAKVVKCFNQAGAENFERRTFDAKPVQFVAGDDAGAKQTVMQLVRDVGYEPVDAGPLTRARDLEHLAILWIELAVAGFGRQWAFGIARQA